MDVSEVFARSLRTALELMTERADALVDALGAEDYRERFDRRSATLAGLERRVLQREIFAATTARAV